MNSHEEVKISKIDYFAPPAEVPEEIQKEFGKIIASNAFIPPPLKRMKGTRNIFELSNKKCSLNLNNQNPRKEMKMCENEK